MKFLSKLFKLLHPNKIYRDPYKCNICGHGLAYVNAPCVSNICKPRRFNGFIDFKDKNRTREIINTDIFYIDSDPLNIKAIPDIYNNIGEAEIKWVIYQGIDGMPQVIPASAIEGMEINSVEIKRS
jgi:hypothetical protein